LKTQKQKATQNAEFDWPVTWYSTSFYEQRVLVMLTHEMNHRHAKHAASAKGVADPTSCTLPEDRRHQGAPETQMQTKIGVGSQYII
jgi:hypothetical protein